MAAQHLDFTRGTRGKKWTLVLDLETFLLNIAKGTTDPRVEFILPKSYCKFKHKS